MEFRRSFLGTKAPFANYNPSISYYYARMKIKNKKNPTQFLSALFIAKSITLLHRELWAAIKTEKVSVQWCMAGKKEQLKYAKRERINIRPFYCMRPNKAAKLLVLFRLGPRFFFKSSFDNRSIFFLKKKAALSLIFVIVRSNGHISPSIWRTCPYEIPNCRNKKQTAPMNGRFN